MGGGGRREANGDAEAPVELLVGPRRTLFEYIDTILATVPALYEEQRRRCCIVRSSSSPTLIAHDASHRTPLLETARAFVECGAHYGRAAERCFVAVSTLKYRIRKIEQLLGSHPADPEVAFRLSLAFKVQDLLTVAASQEGREQAHPGARTIRAAQVERTRDLVPRTA